MLKLETTTHANITEFQDIILVNLFLQTTETSEANICTTRVTSPSHYLIINQRSHQEVEGPEVVSLLQSNKAAKQLTTV